MQISLFTNGKTNTQSVRKASISLAIAAMFFTAGFANAKGPDKRISFQGYLQGNETDVLQGSPPRRFRSTGMSQELRPTSITSRLLTKSR